MLSTSVPLPSAFRLKGLVEGQPCVAMLDIGAMHNFIHERLVSQCGLQVGEFARFRVRVADGYNFTCTRRIQDLSLFLVIMS